LQSFLNRPLRKEIDATSDQTALQARSGRLLKPVEGNSLRFEISVEHLSERKSEMKQAIVVVATIHMADAGDSARLRDEAT